MAFRPKNEALLTETYRHMDELVRLNARDRQLSIAIARAEDERDQVRRRKSELRRRDEEMGWQMRPASQQHITLPEWRNQIRSYQAEIAA